MRKRRISLPLSHIRNDLTRFKRIKRAINELIKDDERALKTKKKHY